MKCNQCEMKCNQCDKDGIVNLGTYDSPKWWCEEHARRQISARKDAMWALHIKESSKLDWLLSQALKRWCRCEQLPHIDCEVAE